MGDAIKKPGQDRFAFSSTSSSDSETEDDNYDSVSLGSSGSGDKNVKPRGGRNSRLPGSSEASSTSLVPALRQEESRASTTFVPANRTGASKGNPHQKPASSISTQPEFQMSTDQRRDTIQAINALLAGARTGDIQQVEKLIGSGVAVDSRDIDGLTALHHAATNGHIRIVSLLVRHGATILAATPLGHTPLALAASRGHGAIVEYLIHLQYSSTLPDKNRDGLDRQTTPAPTAAKDKGRSAGSITVDLFENMAKQCQSMGEGENIEALVDAVGKGNLAGVARMIAALAKTDASGCVIPDCSHVNEVDDKGRSLLITACRAQQPDIAQLLLCAGAKVDQPDRRGYTPLMHAVDTNQPRMVALLLRAGARPESIDRTGNSALTIAIDRGKLAVLQALVDGSVDIWKATAWNEPLIVYAARNKKVDVVKALLQVGADLPDESGSRALARSARAGEDKTVSVLLKAGADPHHKAADGHTAFTLAAANGHEAVLSILLKLHATVEWKQALQAQTDNQGRTALMLAALNRKDQTARFLLNNHADPHQQDHTGRTALLWAAAHATSATMTILIGFHATHICVDKQGDTVFTISADHDNQDVMRSICMPFYKNSKFDINTPNKDGDTALIKAARRGFKSMVELLLANGANPLHVNNAGRKAIHEAGQHGRTEVITCLQQAISAMPPVFPYANDALSFLEKLPLVSKILPSRVPVRGSEFDANGNSLVMLAAANGQHDFLAELLRPRTDADGTDEQEADLAGDSDSESFSLDSKSHVALLNSPSRINIEEKNLDGMTALCLATREGHYDAIKLLIDNGAKVNGALPTQSGNRQELITPLWLAARLVKCATAEGAGGIASQTTYAPEFVVHLLLKSGASSDINTRSWQNQTPLIAAAGAGRVAVVKLLIDHGAKIDIADFHGITPLMHAAWYGHLEIVELLLNHGAAPKVKPGELGALILAAEGGHEYVIQLLYDRGADINQADPSGTTALIGAARHGKASAARRLIALGAHLHLTDDRNRNALYHAAAEGHEEIVSMLKAGSPQPRDH